VHPVHGSTVHRSLNAKGYAPQTIHRRSKGPGREHAGRGGDVAGDKQRGGASPESSPAHPIWLLRAPIRARESSTHSWGAREQGWGVRAVAWASPAAGTVRGRRGYSGEPGETVLRAK
jgi:hypothetical protein